MNQAINTNLYPRSAHPILQSVDPLAIDLRLFDSYRPSVAYALHMSRARIASSKSSVKSIRCMSSKEDGDDNLGDAALPVSRDYRPKPIASFPHSKPRLQ